MGQLGELEYRLRKSYYRINACFLRWFIKRNIILMCVKYLGWHITAATLGKKKRKINFISVSKFIYINALFYSNKYMCNTQIYTCVSINISVYVNLCYQSTRFYNFVWNGFPSAIRDMSNMERVCVCVWREDERDFFFLL